jgi:type I restriction enzyme S subunit
MEHPNGELKELKSSSTGTIGAENYLKTDLGMLPEDWELVSLNDNGIFGFINGLWKGKKEPFVKINVLRNTNFENDGKISYKDVAELYVQKNHYKTRKLEKGDIILERSGGGPKQPVGRVVYFDLNSGNYSFSNFTTRIRVLDKNRCLSKYLHYFLLHFYNKGYTERLQKRTTGIRNLNFNEYKEMLIPLPSINEQNKIVKVLSLTQEAIAKTEIVIETSKSLKKSMMNYLFTYGSVPVNEAEHVPLDNNEIGMVPEEWGIVKLKEIADITMGQSPPGNSYNMDKLGMPLLNGPAEFGDIYPEAVKWTSAPRKISEEDDILFCVRGNTTGRMNISDKKYCIGRGLASISGIEGISNTMYVYYHLERNANKILAAAASGGSTFPNITKSQLNSLLIPNAPKKVQDEISKILDKIDNKIQFEAQKKESLENLFKTFLNDLMTAKIRVNDLEVQNDRF